MRFTRIDHEPVSSSRIARRGLVLAAWAVGLLSLGMHCGDGPCPEAPARQHTEIKDAHAVGAQYVLWELYSDPRYPKRGVVSATLTVSAERRGVVALINTGTALNAAVSDPNALVRRIGAPAANGALALLEAGPGIPSLPTTVTVPPATEDAESRFNALVFVPLEPAATSYALSIAIDEELTEATVTRGNYGTCFPAQPPNLPERLMPGPPPVDAGAD